MKRHLMQPARQYDKPEQPLHTNALCSACGKDSWLKRPSGAIVCASCGGPYVPPDPRLERP